MFPHAEYTVSSRQDCLGTFSLYRAFHLSAGGELQVPAPSQPRQWRMICETDSKRLGKSPVTTIQ